MIDKSHLRTTMLALSNAELKQAHESYEQFLTGAMLDRSETIEAHAQSQAEQSANLAEAFDDLEQEVETKIKVIQSLDFGPKDEVEPGAAVKIGNRFLVIGASTNEFVCQGQKFVGISVEAPIYAALEGKTAGETCDFRGRKLVIDQVY